MNNEKIILDKLILSFKLIFSGNEGHLVTECNCGKTYYSDKSEGDPDLEDFKQDEYETLEQNPNAFITSDGSCPYFIVFNDIRYSSACDCYSDFAIAFVKALDNNHESIACYLNVRKERLEREANDLTKVNV